MVPLSPAEAVRRLNELVTVEMTVRRTKACSGSGQFFLDSEVKYRDPQNLGIVITAAGLARFREAKVANPTDYFKGKTIRVHGTVILKDDRPAIEVSDPAQIEVVG